MSESGSVRVAVRIRPFNTREKELNAKLCLRMEGPTTIITEPETNEEKPFTFDYSYWSHDGFEDNNGELLGVDDKYATQRRVFEDLGRDVLKSAFEGYNSCLFAYGQTGSGKSYSMVGYGKNKGIIPIVCEEMFKTIESNTDKTVSYQVVVSMLEIYNESIKDLLNPKNCPPGGLKIRSKPGIGVYVEDLLPVPVSSYAEIDAKMAEGTANRTVGSTKMNATSSRAHTVFTIIFTTKRTEMGLTSETQSRMNLVDLAGSERADSTGATGDRLKEGCNINASLSALGNVISALADQANGKKKVFVPYRNSALTRLLQDALGGNSRTIMVCALSPADVNYDETLSTLRYANRAKQIKNNVFKMENPTDKIIAALKAENARLMAMLDGKLPPEMQGTIGDMEEMKKKLKQIEEEKMANDKLLLDMQKSWADKLKESQEQQKLQQEAVGSQVMVMSKDIGLIKHPFLINLHEDPLLTESVMYVFQPGTTVVGRQDTCPTPQIVLAGLNIKAKHAVIENHQGSGVVIKACEPHTKLFVNGQVVDVNGVTLKDNDRIIIGNNFVFRYCTPNYVAADDQWHGPQAYNSAMNEYQTIQGLRIQQSMTAVHEMEQQDTAKTKELQDKIALMERELEKERSAQMKMLVDQEKIMMSSNLSDTDKQAQIEKIKKDYASKLSELESNAEKKKEVTIRAIQEQVKKKRQMKKIGDVIAKMAPLIQEANSMSEEMGKNIKFETKLVVSSSTSSTRETTKSIETIVEVVDTKSPFKNKLIWDTDKFEMRLFMMRDLYHDIMEYGPKQIKATSDPFWDPPQAVHIGSARVVLKALSQLVEIEQDSMITDLQGVPQGSLRIEIQPQDDYGGNCDYLAKSTQLLNMNVKFNISVPYLKLNSLQNCQNVYIESKFFDFNLQSDACTMKTNMPRLAYNTTLSFSRISDDVHQYLLTGAMVVDVYGFNDEQTDEFTQSASWMTFNPRVVPHCTDAAPDRIVIHQDKVPTVVASLKSQLAKGMVPRKLEVLVVEESPEMDYTYTQYDLMSPSNQATKNTATCDQCHENPAAILCKECENKVYCTHCFPIMHKAARRKDHVATPLSPTVNTSNTPIICQQCNTNDAEHNCGACSKLYCGHCNTLMHKAASRRDHVRVPIVANNNSNSSDTPEPITCAQCQENKATKQCNECNKCFCDHCNNVMHKAASRRQHVRTDM